jgi:DNA-binding NarL/FixJ family response regulator
LVDAIEREFTSITVEHVPTLEAACVEFEFPVSLMLVDSKFLPEIDGYGPLLAKCHTPAKIALLQCDDRIPIVALEVMAAGLVVGVLPMNLKLDIWLSVIRLMLRGGEYYPLAMLRSRVYQNTAKADGLEAPHQGHGKEFQPDEARAKAGGGLGSLTVREHQILEMVSQGMQNKTIASALQLSEYTVKIHLHHIIRKLGAHNRTQAAAILHERASGDQRGITDGLRSG